MNLECLFDLNLTVPTRILPTPLLIRLKSGSPIFFRQQRLGLHGEPFTRFKFCTMPDARSAGLNEGGVRQALLELCDAVISFNHQGRVVKLEGLGTYTPSIDLAGTLKVSRRADKALKNAINAAQGAFKGEIANRANIGKTGDSLAALWDTDDPGDVVGVLLVISERP